MIVATMKLFVIKSHFHSCLSVPGAPPSNIRAIGASGSSINITWSEVPEEGRNGIVRGYKVIILHVVCIQWLLVILVN